jgi:hypothetical protein
VIHEGAALCVLCEFHKQECTFVQSPLPRKRKVVDGEKKDSPNNTKTFYTTVPRLVFLDLAAELGSGSGYTVFVSPIMSRVHV